MPCYHYVSYVTIRLLCISSLLPCIIKPLPPITDWFCLSSSITMQLWLNSNRCFFSTCSLKHLNINNNIWYLSSWSWWICQHMEILVRITCLIRLFLKCSFIYKAVIPVAVHCSVLITDALLFTFFSIRIFLHHSSRGYANVSHSLPTYALYNHKLDTVWFSSSGSWVFIWTRVLLSIAINNGN